MPFQSEKQRRYMHANLPEIAKRWERDYANGGIARVPLGTGGFPDFFQMTPENIAAARNTSWPSAIKQDWGAGWRRNPTNVAQGSRVGARSYINQGINSLRGKFNPGSNVGGATNLMRKVALGAKNVLPRLLSKAALPLELLRATPANADEVNMTEQDWENLRSGNKSPQNNYKEEFKSLYDQGTYDNFSLAMDDAERYAKGEKTNHEKLTGYNPITDIYDRDYTAGEHYNMTPDAITRSMQTRGPDHMRRQTNFPTASHMRRQTNFPTSTAQQFANLGRPHTGFEEYDKWGNRRMAQEKMDPARPQKKGLGAGITAAWSALKGSPLGSVVAQAFRGPQLTPQQKQMNTNFMKQYGVTRDSPTMGGRMVGGPFAGMNAPGTSAFGSKTSQEMAQKWMNKYGGMKYTTPKMQQKQQQIKNIATMNQGPAGINTGSGDKGQHTTQGKSTGSYQGHGSHHFNRGGLAGLWPS